MIRGGTLQHNHIHFVTDNAKDAERLRGMLVGNKYSTFFTTSPYNERVVVNQDAQHITLHKNGDSSFTYEELKQIVRKLRSFHFMTREHALELRASARRLLPANFTLFYPDHKDPIVEITFLQNWASMTFESPLFKKLYALLQPVIARNMGEEVRVFCNYTDTVSIHHYEMKGLFIGYKTFKEIAGILAAGKVLEKEAIHHFATEATRFGMQSISYLEARQLCVAADQVYERADNHSESPYSHAGMKPVLDILAILAKTGRFDDLEDEQITFLRGFLENPRNVERYPGSDETRDTIRSLVHTFAPEIQYSANARNAITMASAPPELLKDAMGSDCGEMDEAHEAEPASADNNSHDEAVAW